MHDHSLDEPIPYDWTADQALAVVEFLEALAERVWSRYGFAIREVFQSHPPPTHSPQLTLPFPPLWHYGIGIDKDDEDNISW